MTEERIIFRDASYFLVNGQVYSRAVEKMEREGLTTSDAQGVVDAQLFGKYRNLIQRLTTVHGRALLSLHELIRKAEEKGYPCQETKTSLISVCNQICTPRDVSNLEIFLKVLKKVEDGLTPEETDKIDTIHRELKGIIEAPAKWKTVF